VCSSDLDKGDFRRDEVKPRAPGEESAGGGFRVDSTSTYSCDVFAYHKDVADQIRANADASMDVDEDATRYVTNLFLIQRERKWVTDYFALSIWDTDVVGTTNFVKWDDASSDPEADVDTGKAQILKDTGQEPNTLVVGYEVHKALKRHPLITERFKYTTADSITVDMLARFFEIDRYMVSKASYNSASENATDVNAFIAGKNALLCYVAPIPGLLTASAGYPFVWRGLTGASTVGVAVSNFLLKRNKADRIEGEFAYDQKAVATDMGYFFSAAVS